MKGFEDLNEMVFFEENRDRMIYHKKTIENLKVIIQKIFTSEKSFISDKIFNGLKVIPTEVKMNTPMTVLYVYFILPELETTKQEIKTEYNNDEVKKILIKFNSGDRKNPDAPYQLTADEKILKDKIYKDIENKLNKYKKKLSSMISEHINFKYILDCRFVKDDFYKDIETFNEIAQNLDKGLS